ncbi:MAG: hypothetical protein H7274_10530 [Rhodoferax sp.]|nr:hypothetical protein [Rhodoferax sp.]
MAFELAKVLVNKWQEDCGDAIPAHRLFPQMLDAASHFIESHVTLVKTRTRQDLAINLYFSKAVAMKGKRSRAPVPSDRRSRHRQDRHKSVQRPMTTTCRSDLPFTKQAGRARPQRQPMCTRYISREAGDMERHWHVGSRNPWRGGEVCELPGAR